MVLDDTIMLLLNCFTVPVIWVVFVSFSCLVTTLLKTPLSFPISGTTKMSYIPFGAGRQVCIGESVAKSELFVTSVSLLQKFKFENPPGCPPTGRGVGAPYQLTVKFSAIFISYQLKYLALSQLTVNVW